MDINYIVTTIITTAGSGLIVLAAGYYLIKPDIQKHLNIRAQGLKKEEKPHLLMLRLQAHERLLLFVERINPTNMLVRLHQQGLSVKNLQSILLQEIRTEYQHNVTQQLYLSTETWTVIERLKEDTLAMVNNAARGFAADTEGVELSRKILQHMAGMSDSPYDLTLMVIKQDIQRLF